jgi:hypothetical protein
MLRQDDGVDVRLRAQHLRQMTETGARQGFVAKIDLQEDGIRRAFLDESRERVRLRRGCGGHLGARPVAGHMVGQPLQAFGVAAHH